MTQGKQTIGDSDILGAIEEAEGSFVTAVELAETFGMTRQWAHNRLQQLYEDGRLQRKKSGPRNVIWWLPRD
jgi:DNA-binding IclR family transcriptional regulator